MATLKELVSQFDTGNLTDFAAIKKGHLQWRNRLVDMFEGRAALKPNDVSDHHQCALGKWYDGEGARYSHLHSFALLGERHEAFHKLVARIVELWHGNKRAEAAQEFLEILPLTRELFGVLDSVALEAVGTADTEHGQAPVDTMEVPRRAPTHRHHATANPQRRMDRETALLLRS